MKIGFTERGDAGYDLSWKAYCQNGVVDGAVIITKNLTQPCSDALLELHRSNFPLILHAGCTGWGGTIMEPGAPDPKDQLDAVCNLIANGFPRENIVLRIDPILPTKEGIERAKYVIDEAIRHGLLPGLRVRISIIDEYKHVKKRMYARGITPCYTNGAFGPTASQISDVAAMLLPYAKQYFITFETCAEPHMNAQFPDLTTGVGCISEKDLAIMGLTVDTASINAQNRYGCKCLAVKQELLKHKHPCANNCAYCYWKDL